MKTQGKICGITSVADGGSATLPLDGIAKAHVVYNFDTDGGHRE